MMGKGTSQVHTAQSKIEDETEKTRFPRSQKWQGRARETPGALCACRTPLSIHKGTQCRSRTSAFCLCAIPRTLKHMTCPNKMDGSAHSHLLFLSFLKNRLFSNRHKLLCIFKSQTHYTTTGISHSVSSERSSWHRQPCSQSSHVIRSSSTRDTFSYLVGIEHEILLPVSLTLYLNNTV